MLCVVSGLVPGGKEKGLSLVTFDLERILNFIFYSQVADGNSITPVLERC